MALAMAALRLSVSARGVPSAPSTANRSMPFGVSAERRKQLLGNLGIELLDIGHFAIAKLRELATAHRSEREVVFFFVFVHRTLSSSLRGLAKARSSNSKFSRR